MRAQIITHAGLLFAGVATFILMGAGQALYGPALPAFSRLFGIGLGQAGLVVSAHWVGCFAGVGIMYFRGSRIGPRHGLAAMGLGSALLALGAMTGAGIGWASALGGAFLFGIGYGGCTVLFNPRFLLAFGPGGPGMMSLLNATFGVGAIAAPLVFVALGTDPVLSFACLAVLAALVWLGAGQAGTGGAVDRAGVVAGGFRPHWPLLGFGMVAIGLEAMLIGLGPSALIAAGQSESAAAGLLSGFFVAFLGMRVVLGFTAHLIAPFSLFTGAVALAACFGLGAALISPPVFFVALGGCTGLLFPSFFVATARQMGNDPRVAPVIVAAGLVGGIGGPLVMSRYLETLGERGFFWVLAGAAAALALAASSQLRAINR